MYRSASTLQFQIATRLVKDAGIGQQVGWIDANYFSEVRDSYAHYSGFKVVKVHQYTNPMGLEFTHNNAIGIYTFRDIRDVYASMMQQQQKAFADIWNWYGRDFIETCLENYQRWTSLPSVLVSRYEEIREDLPREVQRIAKHFNVYFDSSQYQNLADEYGLEIQRKRVKKFTEELLQKQLNPNDHREIVDYHDEDTLLHMNHMGSAKVGRWQEDLLPEEVVLIENKVKEWCKENKDESSTFLC